MSSDSATAKKGKTPRLLVIGAGSRGNSYARAVTNATSGVVHAVAEIDPFKRREFGRKYIWGAEGKPAPGQEFSHWRDWIEWETSCREQRQRQRQQQVDGDDDDDEKEGGDGVDGVFVCTLDESHIKVLLALAPLNLHVMCEKPLATSLDDCLAISDALSAAQKQANSPRIFSIGHVLRYSPHNRLLRKLLLTDRVVGDIVSLEHTEPVGWSHFAHSYVRGNWRRETPGNKDGSLLTKCCHDIDFILWLLCSPAPGMPYDHPYHAPSSITSMGSLTQFKRSRKPAAAGSATNCLSCPIERDCMYSAVKHYRDKYLRAGKTGWPVKIVCPDIEDTMRDQGPQAAEARLQQALGEDYDAAVKPDSEIAARPWFGRCVWESDNSVCDDQVVSIKWDDGPLPDGLSSSSSHTSKLATLHMIAPTEKQCDRRGRVYGTLGELTYDSNTITTHTFTTGETTTTEIPPPPPDEKESHGGGDYGLTRAFVQAVDAVENDGWEVRKAQAEFVGCTLEEAVRSHAVVFAAEEARRKGLMIDWNKWWREKTGQTDQN